jgi:transforming growth factor-beta-induced protein
MKRWMAAWAALTTVTLLAACGGGGSDETPAATTSQDLAQVARATPGTSTMLSAMDSAGMSSVMRDSRALTVLMPTDEALAEYAEDLAELKRPENRAALQDFLKAHVIDSTVLADQLRQAAQAPERRQALGATDSAGATTAAPAASLTISVTNLLGEVLEIEIDNGVLFINGAEVGRIDIRASNGVLHLLKAPLFRPSVFSVVRRDPKLSILEAALRAADLDDALRGPGPLTLFAPTDQAFGRLLAELNLTAAQLLANRPLLTEVLTYHVLATRALSRELEDGQTPVTLQGQAITLDVSARGNGRGAKRDIEITDARDRVSKVSRADIRARNGVVHQIDRVLLPSDRTLVQIAAGLPQFSILVEAVVAAGLVDTLSGPGPFTVFAPTNDAFAEVLGELGLTKAQLLANKPLLTQVLTYHVLGGRVLADGIRDRLAVASVEGQPFVFRKGAAGVSITDARGRSAKVVATNVQAANGVIHVIDRVILPTPSNLVQLAQSLPQFSILVEAVVAADLAGTLSGPGKFTVFAPTNDAFAALLGELGLTKAQLLANKPLLTAVLTYHVLPAQVLSSGIPFGQPVTTVQGQTFTIGRDLKITDARGRRAGIAATDVAASNGVVHVIDRVILPR